MPCKKDRQWKKRKEKETGNRTCSRVDRRRAVRRPIGPAYTLPYLLPVGFRYSLSLHEQLRLLSERVRYRLFRTERNLRQVGFLLL